MPRLQTEPDSERDPTRSANAQQTQARGQGPRAWLAATWARAAAARGADELRELDADWAPGRDDDHRAVGFEQALRESEAAIRERIAVEPRPEPFDQVRDGIPRERWALAFCFGSSIGNFDRLDGHGWFASTDFLGPDHEARSRVER